MTGRGAIYSFSFDLGPGLDLVKLANKLLKTDMATVAGSPSRDGLRVGSRMRETARFQEHAARYQQWLEIFHTGKIQWWRLFRLEPKITLRILWIARPHLWQFFAHRATFGLAYRTSLQSSYERAESREADPENEEHQRQVEEMVREASEKLVKSISSRHASGALRLRLQQQMYFPRYYLHNEPFIRLEMNRSYYTDSDHKHEPIEISLMIHRSGICILTFATPIATEFGVDQGYKYLQAGKRVLNAVEVSVPILGTRPRFMDENYYRWRMAVNDFDHLEWVSFKAPADGKNHITIETVFDLYLEAIQRAARRNIQAEWRCNTTLFQGSPLCGCEGAIAKQAHAVEFAQLMVRSRSPMPVTDEVRAELLKNYLLNSEEELWLSTGHAIHTFWPRSDIHYITDLQTVEPIESAILQHRQLEAIDHRTVNLSVRDDDLFAAQKQLATGLPEYGRNLLTDINASSVVDGMAAKLRTSELYSRLNDRVKMLESVVNTRYARKQSRRSIAISAIGLGIVLILLLPRVDELLNKLSVLSPTGSKVAALRDFFGGPDQATVAVYIVAIALATLVLFRLSVPYPRARSLVSALRGGFARLKRRISWLRRLKRPKRSFGYATKHDVIVERRVPDDTGDDEDDD